MVVVVRGGKPLSKTSLHKILVNVTYIGKTKYKVEIFDGEQPAIVPLPLWKKVQVLLTRNNRSGGTLVEIKKQKDGQFEVELRGLDVYDSTIERSGFILVGSTVSLP